MKQRVLTALLAFLLMFSLLAGLISCADPSSPDQPDPPQDPDDPSTPDDPGTDPEKEPPTIPDSLLGTGETITIVTEGWATYAPLDVPDIAVEGFTDSNALSSAAYRRNEWIKEYLGVELEFRNYPHYTESFPVMSTLINSGTCDVDFWLLRGAAYGSCISNNLLMPLGEDALTYFDPERVWWDSNSYSALSIAGEHYGVIGDFTVADDMTYWNVFFNKGMISDYDLESPYELVKSGNWTYEKMYEMASVVAEDIISGEVRYDDPHGISMIRDVLAGALNTAGIMIAEKDNNDLPVPTFYSDRTVTVFEDLCDIFYDSQVVYNCHVKNCDEIAIFTDGNTLFTMGGVYYGPQMRNTEVDFGILPMPKYEESDEYRSATSPLFVNILAVPLSGTNEHLDLTGAFMELYAYKGNESVVPAFHERLLRSQIARDDESEAMIDYIFANTVFDLGSIFNFGNFSFTLIDMMYSNNRNIASTWRTNETLVNADIDKLVDALLN